MKERYLVSNDSSQSIVTLDRYHAHYHSLIYKPSSQSYDEFKSHVKQELSQYSQVGNLVPIHVSGTDNIYFIRAVTEDPSNLGFSTVFPPIHDIEWNKIREELQKGNLEVLNFKKNKLFESTLSEHNLELITPDFSEINLELINYLAKHPEYLHELHWRKFEELLATLFKAKGFDTELGPGSGDGGVDIRLLSHSDIEGQLMTLVQAKRYAEHNKIKLAPVQALYGVLESEKASKGLFVTTSSYEKCAKQFAESKPFRLQLAGPEDITRWLKEHTQYK